MVKNVLNENLTLSRPVFEWFITKSIIFKWFTRRAYLEYAFQIKHFVEDRPFFSASERNFSLVFTSYFQKALFYGLF